MLTLAFHGDRPANAAMLRRDCGDPPWIDRYWDGHNAEAVADLIAKQPDQLVNVIAYSRAGELVGKLTHILQERGALYQIRSAVLYEAPLLRSPAPAQELSNFRVLWIRNRHGRGRFLWGKKEMQRSFDAWSANRSLTSLWGRGFHMRPVLRWPPLGHAWDRQLNDSIWSWIQTGRLPPKPQNSRLTNDAQRTPTASR